MEMLDYYFLEFLLKVDLDMMKVRIFDEMILNKYYLFLVL